MVRQRKKMDEAILYSGEENEKVVLEGDDFNSCVKLFLDELELRNLSYHTLRWHKENLHYVEQTLSKLDLQKLLGHSSLDMVRHYVDLWGSDLQQMHKKFSPVEGLFRK